MEKLSKLIMSDDEVRPLKKQPTFKGSRRLLNVDGDQLASVFQDVLKGKSFRDVPVEQKPAADMIKWPTGMDPSRAGTADLCDFFISHADDQASKTHGVKVMGQGFKDYGGLASFSGKVTTMKCYETNPLVRKILNEDGTGRVLVVDGGGSMRCALFGDRLAELAANRNWSGLVINGAVRDTGEICTFDIGIKALGTNPLKPGRRDMGQRDVPVSVGGVVVNTGDWLYADSDGIIVSANELKLPDAPNMGKVGLSIPQ